jgi:uncharacterized protein (DUF58 family)
MNSKLVTLFAVTAALLLAALVSLNGEVAWLVMPFLAYLGVGILRSPAAEHIRLQATRTVEQVEEQGKRCIQVTVTVHNQGTSTLDQVCLVDQKQTGMRSLHGQVQQWQSLATGGESTLTYNFQTLRGLFTWETVQVIIFDSLGILETRLDLPAEAAVQVHPEMIRFQSVPVRPQRTLHLSGPIPARLGGSGTDFWGIREYQPGDPLRRMDWHHVARHPGRRYTREFEQEEIAEIGLILDARQGTDIRVGEDSLFEHSIRAAASLAEVFIHQGNRVSLLVYGDPLISVYPGYGKGQLNQILNTLSRVTTEAGGSLGGLQYLPVRMFSSRSIVLIISPLTIEDWRLFPRLRAYGYQVFLVSPDPVDFAHQTIPEDVPSQLAIRLSQVERRLEIQRITRMWIPVIDWKVNQPLQPLVCSALAYSHLQPKR